MDLEAASQAYEGLFKINGGEGGIRTHGRVAPSPVFKTGAFNRSATSPFSVKAMKLLHNF